MDSTATEKRLGLAIKKPVGMVLCGFVICYRKEYPELEYGPGVTTRGLILRVTETT